MSLLCPVAQAAGIPVNGDAGSLGMFQLTNTGISGGVSTLVLSLPTPGAEMITSINASPMIVPAAFQAPITLEVTSLGGGAYSIALSPATYTKTFGSGTATAELTYNLTAGQVVTVGNFSFFNLAGLVTSVVADALPGFTFAPFANGLGLEGITLVAEGGSFAQVISTVGASMTGSGSFSEVAIPEPVSVALLGIGLSGLLTLRRFFRRTSVA
jgi:hypothetical protein